MKIVVPCADEAILRYLNACIVQKQRHTDAKPPTEEKELYTIYEFLKKYPNATVKVNGLSIELEGSAEGKMSDIVKVINDIFNVSGFTDAEIAKIICRRNPERIALYRSGVCRMSFKKLAKTVKQLGVICEISVRKV